MIWRLLICHIECLEEMYICTQTVNSFDLYKVLLNWECYDVVLSVKALPNLLMFTNCHVFCIRKGVMMKRPLPITRLLFALNRIAYEM